MKRLVCLALFLLGTSPAAQSVFVVDDDGGPGVDYTDIVSAVDAAPSGSVVLVRPGSYLELISITAKSVSLVIEDGASFSLASRVCVSNLAADQRVVIRGMNFDAFGDNTNILVTLTDNAGTVWFEDCTFLGTDRAFFTSAETIQVQDSARVVFRDAHLVGGTSAGADGGPAILAQDSSIYLYSTIAAGGMGLVGGRGGTAIFLQDGFLFAAGGSLSGGQGGVGEIAPFGCFSDGGDGGEGLVLAGTNPQARFYNVTLQGGAGGTVDPMCSFDPGVPGQASSILAGTLQEVSGAERQLSIDSPVRTDEQALLEASGPPGEFCWVLFSPNSQPLFLPGLFATLVPPLPHGLIFLGALDASGDASLSIPASVPVGAGARQVFAQALYFSVPSQSFALGSATSVVVLDEVY